MTQWESSLRWKAAGLFRHYKCSGRERESGSGERSFLILHSVIKPITKEIQSFYGSNFNDESIETITQLPIRFVFPSSGKEDLPFISLERYTNSYGCCEGRKEGDMLASAVNLPLQMWEMKGREGVVVAVRHVVRSHCVPSGSESSLSLD